jgi:hypothetical protein
MIEHAAGQDDDVDMWRLSGNTAWHDGIEEEAVLGVRAGAGASEAFEGGVGAALIGGVGVAAGSIRLPDLEQGVA